MSIPVEGWLFSLTSSLDEGDPAPLSPSEDSDSTAEMVNRCWTKNGKKLLAKSYKKAPICTI